MNIVLEALLEDLAKGLRDALEAGEEYMDELDKLTAKEALVDYERYLASQAQAKQEAERLRMLCRICQKAPRQPPFDHCCDADCIPF